VNLEYLKIYLEVVRHGSFTEVAREFSISQPAVSFQIQKLERELGVRLIDRTQKTITVTAAGKRLCRFAESLMEERERLRLDLDQLREEVSGDLVITASTIPGEFLLPSLLAEFKALHPAVKARAIISDSLGVISGVRDNTYEVGFCGIRPDSKYLESFKVAEDEIVLIVFPGHPFAERDEVSPADLEGEPFIFRDETSGTRQNLEISLLKAGFDTGKLEPHLILSTTQAVVSAVEARAGIAFVSNRAIHKSLSLGLVRQITVNGLKLSRDFHCIFRKERTVSRLLEEFINFTRTGVSAPVKDK